MKKLREKNDEINQEAKVFTAKAILEERLKMYNNFKDSDITYWDPEAWEKTLKYLNGEEEVSSKVVRIGESEWVERVDESNDINRNIEYIVCCPRALFLTFFYF